MNSERLATLARGRAQEVTALAKVWVATVQLKVRRSVGTKAMVAGVGIWISAEFVWWVLYQTSFIPKLVAFRPEDASAPLTEVSLCNGTVSLIFRCCNSKTFPSATSTSLWTMSFFSSKTTL